MQVLASRLSMSGNIAFVQLDICPFLYFFVLYFLSEIIDHINWWM